MISSKKNEQVSEKSAIQNTYKKDNCYAYRTVEEVVKTISP